MITRDAFLYMDPKGAAGRFGQCSTCLMWTGKDHNTCTIHGPSLKIFGGDSCGLYVHGKPVPEEAGHEMRSVLPVESGLVSRKVRCENCMVFNEERSVCKLFEKLNDELPDLFDLDEKVDPYGCCNAQQPKGLL